MIGTEWVQTVATAIPIAGASGAVLWAQGWLWRRTIATHHAETLAQLCTERSLTVTALWCGYRLHGREHDIRWVGGWRGAFTLLRRGDRRAQRAGWLDAPSVGAWLDATASTSDARRP
jgi:hypothetical protein